MTLDKRRRLSMIKHRFCQPSFICFYAFTHGKFKRINISITIFSSVLYLLASQVIFITKYSNFIFSPPILIIIFSSFSSFSSFFSPLVGIQSYDGMEEDIIIYTIDNIVLYSFTAELIFKFMSEGLSPVYFFTCKQWKWNVFDLSKN